MAADFKALRKQLKHAEYQLGLVNTLTTDTAVTEVLDVLVQVVDALLSEVEKTPIVQGQP